jgi:inositol-hexakisphosphate kinase
LLPLSISDVCWFERLDKYKGRDAEELEFRNLVKHFFSRRGVLRRDVIQCVLDEILSIKNVLSNLDQMRFYSSSLLIIYEGIEEEKGGSVESENFYSR